MTEEFITQQGHSSFFTRIEEIDENFTDAFEVGSYDLFNDWLDSASDAWVFLESRARIIISTRPDAWREIEAA